MEFSSFFFYLFFFGQIFQFSNTIVSSAKVEVLAQDVPTDKLDSLTEQMDADIGKGLVQQRIKRDTDDDTDDENIPEDVVYIDHRQSGCLAGPRSQGRCDASYAFAVIAFCEWLYCQKTFVFQAFSEQYLIDCGHRHGNEGCNGGNPVNAMEFISNCGLALRELYPYTGIQGDCFYHDSVPSERMGAVRIDEPLVTYIPLNQQSLEEHLEYGPIIVNVEISYVFLLYTGGVDDNVCHRPEILHTMLLIGHGRENGKDYWLFKNSYFAPGGDGIYKLNKNVGCFRGGVGIGLIGHLFG